MSFKDIKNASDVHTIESKDRDQLFRDLILAAECISVFEVKNIWEFGALQVVSAFLDRYSIFVESAELLSNMNRGTIRIRLKCQIPSNNAGGYADIQSAYSKNYYLTDCGGYDVFNRTFGKEIAPRLMNVCDLVVPTDKDTILDIGCGRGELSFALSRSGAKVTGVDYSEDAIRIANDTYGSDDENLEFIKKDVFEIYDFDKYNKYIMADVVEHIEQNVLEQIFERISLSVKRRKGRDDVGLVVHTAPNRSYYEEYYRSIREEALSVGIWTPKEPRSYYEQLMHINEQTVDGLRESLLKFFPAVAVWTGSIEDIEDKKSYEEMIKENEIFAVASDNEKFIDNIINSMKPIMERPTVCSSCVKIEIIDDRARRVNEGHYSIAVDTLHDWDLSIRVINTGETILTTRRKWPIFITYHIVSGSGENLVWDGKRTPIWSKLRRNDSVDTKLSIAGVEKRSCQQECQLVISLVAENAFWFNQNGDNQVVVDLLMS